MFTVIEIDRSDYTVYKNRELIKNIDDEVANELWDLSEPYTKNAVWIRKGASIHSEFHLSDRSVTQFLAKIDSL